ncbi:MAG: delta-60 repeat domain-containing protein, partial [Pyrinomonadaceae bacterium]
MKKQCPLRSMKVTQLICLLVLFRAATSTSLFAQQPGDLDPTFGIGGKVTTQVGAPSSGYDVAIQPDGKIIVVGGYDYNGDGDFDVARYNPDGSLDTTFDSDGKVTSVITVTNTNDSGAGSLRQAIADATPVSTINFDPNVFATPRTITLTSGQLVIDKNLTIQGPGANLLSISGNNAPMAFSVNDGVMATLGGMTIRDAYAGSGIRNAGNLSVNNLIVYGNGSGGIANLGNLTINNSTINGNAANYQFYATGKGGGIFNGLGTLAITNSTIADNIARDGGGIYNLGTTLISNCTISGNLTSYDINGDTESGGGIWTNGTLIVTNSTISNNIAEWFYDSGRYSGGISSYGGTETLRNSIVAGNSGCCVTPMVDIIGVIDLASHNLIGDAASSGGITNGVNGNIVGVNPLLGPLQNNGGPTMTHALLSGSPAINAGDNALAISSTD